MLEALCRGVILPASQTGADGDIDPPSGHLLCRVFFLPFPFGEWLFAQLICLELGVRFRLLEGRLDTQKTGAPSWDSHPFPCPRLVNGLRAYRAGTHRYRVWSTSRGALMCQ